MPVRTTQVATPWRDQIAQTVNTALGPMQFARIGEGPVVLALHGAVGGWDQAMVVFGWLAAEGFTVVSPSRPGYLGTPLSVGATIAEQADAMAALLDALGIDRVAVCAWSAGGAIAYEFALRHPERLWALVNTGAPSGPYTVNMSHAGALGQKLFFSNPGAWVVSTLARHFPSMAAEHVLSEEGHLDHDEVKKRAAMIVHDLRRRTHLLGFYETLMPMAPRKPGIDNDLAQLATQPRMALGRITAPSLIVHGTADADVAFADSEYAAGTILGAEHIWIERGAHLAALFDSETSDKVQDQIVDFLAARAPAPPPAR